MRRDGVRAVRGRDGRRGLGEGWRDGACAVGDLGRVVADEVLGGCRGGRDLLRGELLDLRGLLVDDGGGVGDLLVDELLVGLVDQRGQEEDRGGDEGEAPEGHDLDEVVGGERAEEGLVGVSLAWNSWR